ncbi:hypothetical protein [Salibacterium lacus]|uniref:Uncharacterized protein n=1 Tax=Salibacterium lacus TaxID=1898109 RepID=A0ABW5T105_9BACI
MNKSGESIEKRRESIEKSKESIKKIGNGRRIDRETRESINKPREPIEKMQRAIDKLGELSWKHQNPGRNHPDVQKNREMRAASPVSAI